MLIYAFLVFAFIQLFYWVGYLRGSYPEPETPPALPGQFAPVSVIVCFRNEASTLGPLVERILEQAYSGPFELVLVDDNSTDASAAVVSPYVARYVNVRLLDPGATRPGKKDALAYGIAHALHDLLLLTDADCLPASNRWLSLMTAPLRRSYELVLGVSPLSLGRATGWLRRWQYFESVYVSLKYLGFARRGMPYMGVGRNLAYTRNFYDRSGGLAAHADLPSGDDDLLVAGNANPARTALVTHPAAWAYAAGPATWAGYFRQRARHQSTGGHYPRAVALHLGALALSHGLFYLLGFLVLLTGGWWVAVLAYLLRLAFVLRAYARPRRGAATPAGLSAEFCGGAGAGKKTKAWGRDWRCPQWATVVAGDFFVGPMYLYLAVSPLLKRGDW